jgi:transcription initiation factor TFIIIB Brf1 subunit/transcription initiation factor TFIIB
MPLKIKCPKCGEEDVVPDASIHKCGQCNSCGSTFAIRDVVQSVPQPIESQHASAKNGGVVIRIAVVIGLVICVSLILYRSLSPFWSSVHDTWENDNFALITEQCNVTLRATQGSDDNAAMDAYMELDSIVGGHVIESELLASRIDVVRRAIDPVRKRLEQNERVRLARLCADREQRIAEEEERQQAALYKGFTESELDRAYERLRQEGYSAEEAILSLKAILDYPDTTAVLRQWLDNNGD